LAGRVRDARGGLDVGTGATLTLSAASGTHILDTTTLRNHGTVNLADTFYLQHDVAVVNETGGVWQVAGDRLIVTNVGGTQTFTNVGILRKTSGAGVLEFRGVAVTNTGTIDVETGNFLASSMSNAGLLQVATGATLDLSSVTLQAGTTFAGNGTLLLSGVGTATTTLAADVTVTLPLRMAANVARLSGPGKLTLGAPMDWQAGWSCSEAGWTSAPARR